MATMRNLPDAHPVNKLLRPHFRYTIAINTRARSSLINEGGVIDQIFSIGGQGKVELFKRTSEAYTVDVTNIKQSIEERGLESVPKFYYRDDGLKFWEYFESFASAIPVKCISNFVAKLKEYEKEVKARNATMDVPYIYLLPEKVPNSITI